MAKSVSDPVLDASHNYIKNATGLTQILCSAQPTTRTEAVTTYALADVALAAADVTVADGTTGRRGTVAAKSGVTVDVGGTGNHMALVSSTELLRVTTTPSTAVASGGTVDMGSWYFEIGDPT